MKLALSLRLAIGLLALTTAALPLYAQSRSRSRGKTADWNQWRGPNRDNISPDTGLLKQWPSGGPPLAWKATGIGNGFSSVSITGGRVYTMGESGGKTNVVALSEKDGKILWKTAVGRPGGSRGTGPRSTPATDGRMVFAICQNGEVVATDAARGRILWKKDLNSLGGSRPGWYFSESPLLDDKLVVFTVPGNGGTTVVAMSKTGRLAWKSNKKLKGSNRHYTSLAVAEMGRVKQYIVLTDRSVAGVLSRNGAVLWETDFPGQTAVCSTPVYGNGHVFVAAGYGVGCKGVRIALAGNRIRYQDLYSNKNMINHHGGVVLIGDHVYGTDERSLKCIDIKTGNVVWENGSVGKGSITFADGHLIVRSEDGPVALVEATPEGHRQKGRFDQPDRSNLNSWAHPVVFGGKLYLRDQDVLLCYDLKAK